VHNVVLPAVLEDLIYPEAEVSYSTEVADLAAALSTLIPESEPATRTRFLSRFVVIPDLDFCGLMQSTVPVQARVKLTGGKTTDKWENKENGEAENGNLWYEEYLPSDCLLVSLIGERRTRSRGQGQAASVAASPKATLNDLIGKADVFKVVQVGGNETVGHGLALCSLLPQVRRTLS